MGDTGVGPAAGPAEARTKHSRTSGLPSRSENPRAQHAQHEALAAISGAAVHAASSEILAVKHAGSVVAQARLLHYIVIMRPHCGAKTGFWGLKALFKVSGMSQQAVCSFPLCI